MEVLNFLVQLDPRLQEVIAVLVTFAVSYLILKAGELYPPLGEYLGQYKAGIVTWLTGLVVQVLQAQLDKVPANWDNVALLGMQLLAEVIVILFGFSLLRKRGVRALQYK